MKALCVIITICMLGLLQVEAAGLLKLRTYALAAEPRIPDRYVRVGEEYVKLEFSATDPSKIVEALVDGKGSKLPLFELIKREDGSMSYQIAEKVPFPEGAKGALLLGWVDGGQSKYLAIDDNYLGAKYNDWLLINAASKEVAFRIGQDANPMMVNPSSVKSYKLELKEGVGAAVVGQAKWGDKVKTFYSTYWPIRDGERGIVILFHNRGDRIAVRKITDVLLKPDEAKDP